MTKGLWGDVDMADCVFLHIKRQGDLALEQEVSPVEADKFFASRFGDSVRRAQFLYGRGVLRRLMSSIQPEALSSPIDVDSKGRPFWRKDGELSKWDFNLSHSENWLAVAFVFQGRVGVDVQVREAKTFREMIRLAHRICHAQELKYLEGLTDATEQLDFLYRVWTCKEAMTKLDGIGLQRGFATLDLSEFLLSEARHDGWVELVKYAGERVALQFWSTDQFSLSVAWAPPHYVVQKNFVGDGVKFEVDLLPNESL